MAVALEWGAKDPDEAIEYAVDFTGALQPGDSLASVLFTFVEQGGLAKANERIDGALARVKITGGTSGASAKLVCRITTAGGEILEEAIKLKVKSV